ncbi:putative tetraacyldisaccharide 4'-kinase [Cucumis melo var. makuwa]|uniref:Tetraacyldisaccharide 4'-kinase n=1 Tax=Cucumis melo var. makuwa TaxID=1194695 RepID=A0A5D3CSY2_CUCMM|nr:putative tetraacyldisaccharide 4'-kinase [Cucumis melo var. makuwa]TYK14615.1 putative tetraacyldisaccharide 4'-kinase [Cucumis melo var. makuwa]
MKTEGKQDVNSVKRGKSLHGFHFSSPASLSFDADLQKGSSTLNSSNTKPCFMRMISWNEVRSMKHKVGRKVMKDLRTENSHDNLSNPMRKQELMMANNQVLNMKFVKLILEVEREEKGNSGTK